MVTLNYANSDPGKFVSRADRAVIEPLQVADA